MHMPVNQAWKQCVTGPVEHDGCLVRRSYRPGGNLCDSSALDKNVAAGDFVLAVENADVCEQDRGG